MKYFVMCFLLGICLFAASGCSYWPQTLEPKYYSDGIKETKEDIDDVAGSRTL